MQAVLPEYAAGMKSAGVWLKVLALCSTVALGSGYVWWSQKKSEERRAKEAEARERMILSGSKSKVMVDEPQTFDGSVPPFDEAKGATTPAGSRTNADFIGPIAEQKEERTVLPGSKSAAIGSAPIGSINRQSIESILNLRTTEEESEKKPEKRTVLPGSKSIDPILSPDHKP